MLSLTKDAGQVGKHDIGFTLKAESTCRVLNWQPLDLEDLRQYEELGGNIDEMLNGASEMSRTYPRDGDDIQKKSGLASDESEPDISAKAFAYSR